MAFERKIISWKIFVPVLGLLLHVSSIWVERNHGEGLAGLRVARADVGAVAATQTVEDRRLDDEVHALHGCRSLHL